MEGGQLHHLRVGRPHLEQDLLEGVESRALSVDVVLVHLGKAWGLTWGQLGCPPPWE